MTRQPSSGFIMAWILTAFLALGPGGCSPERTGAAGGGGDGGGPGGGPGEGEGEGEGPSGGEGEGEGGEGEGEGATAEGEGEGGPGEGEGEGEGEGAAQPIGAPPVLTPRVLLEDDEGGRLTIHCPDGRPGVSADDAVAHAAGVYGFPTSGTYVGWCELRDGSRLEATFTVINEMLDTTVAEMAAAAGDLDQALHAALDADGGPDQGMILALEAMEDAADRLAAVGAGPLLRPYPGGLPDPDALAGATPAGADDADLPGLIEAAANAVRGDDSDALEAAGRDLRDLDLSPAAIMRALPALEALVRGDLALSLATGAADVADQLRTALEEEDIPVPARRFGLIGFMIGSFSSMSIRVQLIGKIYGPILAELDTMINTLIIAGIVDAVWGAAGGAPRIDFIFASASVGFACPGYSTTLHGSGFDPIASNNLLVVIGPALQAAFGAIWDAVPQEGDSFYDVWEGVEGALDAIDEAIDSTFVVPQAVERGDISPQLLRIGPWPIEHNGRLPTPIIIIPVNVFTGRGERAELNQMPRCG